MHAFWDVVWNAHDPAAADRIVTEDFVIVTGGESISGRENFKTWIEDFLAKVTDLQDIAMTGTAVWAVREDGKLLTNWVERAAWEQSQRLKL